MELNRILNEMNDLKYNICEEKCINNYDCSTCCEIEECYYDAVSIENSLYAESIDYGGYDSEEEFWEYTVCYQAGGDLYK